MKFIHSICKLVCRKDYMTSLYLKDAFLNILICNSYRLYLRFFLKRFKLPVPGPLFRSVVKPSHFHEDSAPSIKLGKSTEDQSVSILRRSAHNRGIKRGVPKTQLPDTCET
ncbi:hypothetical protein AYI68_g2720 [Smittium mucronatum]|uniref:Uncharacterized protein n=1 Tax=Smittium mucronatum TaxID=133383 RepID=A0A1R0H1X2_9FUNG|nr:hypothetical protein AYI68_g2720 [Smittium mucronatum]